MRLPAVSYRIRLTSSMQSARSTVELRRMARDCEIAKNSARAAANAAFRMATFHSSEKPRRSRVAYAARV